MLLAQAVELLRDKIQALNWVERFGGLTQVVSYETFDQDNRRIEKTIPISCLANSKDCNTLDQFYQNLIPDSSKKSVLYFEPLQGFRDNGAINGNQYFRNYTAQVRLVGWVNSKRLGLSDDCLLSAKLIRSLFPILLSEFKSLTGVLEGAKLRFRNPNVVVKNPNIFSSYTYDIDTQFLINPYDYFAIDIDVVLDLNAGCEYALELPNSALWDGLVFDGSVPADYLGDLTGTFTGVQRFNLIDCEFAGGGDITFVVKGLDRNSLETILGVFTGQFGDTLNDPTKWVTSYDIYDYVAPTLVGDGNIFSFAKLDFAQDKGFTNVDSLEIFVEIRQGSPITTPVVAESILYIFREDIAGTYSTPTHLAILGTDMIVSESSSNTGLSQNFTDRLYTTRSNTNTYNLDQVYRVKIDEPTNYFYFYRSRLLYRHAFTGRDSDGLPTYSAPEVVNSMANITQFIGLCILDERVNGRPVLMVTAVGSNAFIILEWDGVNWISTLMPATGAFAGLASPLSADGEALGNIVYFQNRKSSSGKVVKLSYVGDYKLVGNWSSITLASNTTGQTSEGTGLTASIRNANSLYVDYSRLVNLEPTILLTSNVYHTIQKIVANTTSPLSENDYNITIIAGQSNVSGNVDGELGTNLLQQPTGIDKDLTTGLYWFCERTGSYVVKTLDLDTTDVITRKGIYGVNSKTESIEF